MNYQRETLEDDKKLLLLKAAGGSREWNSLDETRECVLCEHIFSGREVRVAWSRAGTPRLCCPTPGCCATPAQWIHPGNPLVSEDAWRDWVHLLDTLCVEPIHREPRNLPTFSKRLRRTSKKRRMGFGNPPKKLQLAMG